MSMDYIRRTYGVPAKRGGMVRYTNTDNGAVTEGRITGARGPWLRVRFPGT